MQLSDLSYPVPAFSIRLLSGLLDEHGLDGAAALAEAGLSAATLGDPDLLVSGAQEFAVQRAFARLTADRPELWVVAGQRYRTFTWYPLGFAQMTASSLGEALDLARRFAPLHYTPGDFAALPTVDGVCGISLSYDPALAGMSDFLHCRDTISLTQWFNEFWGGQFPFLRIETPSVLARTTLAAGFGDRVAAASVGKWFWREELMAVAPSHADPMLKETYINQCRTILSTRPAAPASNEDGLVGRIAAMVDDRGRYDLSLDEVATALCMSRRSLQRSLANRGTSFRNVIDELRCRAAGRMLRAGDGSIAEIAWRLGYTDSTSFHQAFSRWNHMSPSVYRKQQRGEAAPAREPVPA